MKCLNCGKEISTGQNFCKYCGASVKIQPATNKQAFNLLAEEQEDSQMKKTYKIEVDCANCANLMETETKKRAMAV